MFNKMLRKANNTKGFTMIELIIVIAIIAILAAVLIPRFTGFRDGADKGAATALGRNLMTAHEAMSAEGKTPTEASLATYLQGVNTFNALTPADIIITPTGTGCDAAGFSFTYQRTGGTTFTVSYVRATGVLSITP